MIDWGRVDTLREEVGADGFDEVIAMFLQEVDEVIARFRHAADRARLEHDLHFLKGGALNLGFDSLGRLCQTGERMAAEGRAAEVNIPAVVSLYEDSRRCFLDRLAADRAA